MSRADDGAPRPRILCVDDDPAVLEGLELHLRRLYELRLARGGEQALALLEAQGSCAVVLSDMRMPGMNGAQLLAQVRERWPDSVRVLLTGFADVDAAISAVNDGQVFRFLSKPCAPETLQRAMADAVQQHRLQTAERELLERTLRGALQALAEVLALADAAAFGRASRIQRLALDLAGMVQLEPRWPLELAALLSPIGCVSLPPEVIRKQNAGEPLGSDEQAMVARVPEVTERLLAHIPRLEAVREILRQANRPLQSVASLPEEADLVNICRSAHLLRLATEYETLESEGVPAATVVQMLRARSGRFDALCLQALDTLKCGAGPRVEVRELPMRLLGVGMVFAEDVRTSSGRLLAARGYEVTASFVERVRNFRPGAVREPVRVILPRRRAAARA